jgi:hypothetical protein
MTSPADKNFEQAALDRGCKQDGHGFEAASERTGQHEN